MKQRHVPRAMLGRVSSLDWLISIGLLPLSFALTGPVAGAIGTRGTLVAAGVVGAVVTCAAFFVPGMRDIERTGGSRRAQATSLADVEAPAAQRAA
jgi:DHA3 family tetracycline resistance protein-like MFS transporter